MLHSPKQKQQNVFTSMIACSKISCKLKTQFPTVSLPSSLSPRPAHQNQDQIIQRISALFFFCSSSCHIFCFFSSCSTIVMHSAPICRNTQKNLISSHVSTKALTGVSKQVLYDSSDLVSFQSSWHGWDHVKV